MSEAKTSSEIENIHTTTEELIGLTNETENSKNIKEVLHYKDAITEIFNKIKERSKNKKNNMFISENDIIDINTIIREHNESYRNIKGTIITNDKANKFYIYHHKTTMTLKNICLI